MESIKTQRMSGPFRSDNGIIQQKQGVIDALAQFRIRGSARVRLQQFETRTSNMNQTIHNIQKNAEAPSGNREQRDNKSVQDFHLQRSSDGCRARFVLKDGV